MLPLIVLTLAGCVRSSDPKGLDTGDQHDSTSSSAIDWGSVSLNSRFGCALDTDGYTTCSGVGGYGSPAGYEPDEPLSDITTSFASGCGLREDMTPLCFGYADEAHFENIILIPAPEVSMLSLASGSVTLCGIQADDNHAICWGSNAAGVPGNEPEEGFVSLSQSLFGVCGVTLSGEISCWGQEDEPVNSPPGGEFTSLDMGGVVGVAIDSSGALEPWGYEVYDLWDVPGGSFVQVAVGAWTEGAHSGLGGETTTSGHACAIDKDGELVCWGDDRYGATDVPGLGPGWTDVDANGLATCGIHSGDIYCWGTMASQQDVFSTE